MEINKYFDITGAVTAEAIVAGRMCVLDTHSQSHDFGSRTDLPAVRLPNNATDANRARYCVTFAVDNSVPPLYEPYPGFTFALRQGFDQAENVPFTAAVHLTAPSMKEGLTVPSGALALAFGPGVYTVPSGAFVYSSDLEPGAFLEVLNSDDDGAASAGKLSYTGSASFAQVERFNSADYTLTFRINY